MCCRRFWKSVAPFSLAFALSVFASSFLLKNAPQSESQSPVEPTHKVKCLNSESSYGEGGGGGGRVESDSHKVKILSKTPADYTDAARQNVVTGVVRLRVTFLADGSIGSVTPVTGLPYGLTEQAIAAAKQIKFQPAVRDRQPVTTTKIVEYSFTIY